MKKILSLLVAVMASVMALNAQIVYALNESFESGIPSTWTQEFISGDVAWTVETATLEDPLFYPEGAYAGSSRAVFRNTTGETKGWKTRLITPVMNLDTLLQPILRFFYAQAKWTADIDTLRVLYRKNAQSEWAVLDGCNLVKAQNNWSFMQVELPQPTSTYQIAFEASENLGRGVVLDSVIVRPKPECTQPHDISISGMGQGNVTVSWIAGLDPNEYQLYLIKSDVVIDLDTMDYQAAKASGLLVKDTVVDGMRQNAYCRFKNIAAKNNYVVYVRSLCDLENSDWTSYQFFMREIRYLPYYESFDMGSISGTLGRLEYWTYGNNTDKYNPFINTHQSEVDAKLYVKSGRALCFTGGNNVGNGFEIPANKYVYAAAPEVVDTLDKNMKIQDLQVRFWASLGPYGSFRNFARGLIIGVMSDAADVSTFVPVDTIYLWKFATYEEFIVSLENYQGTGGAVALMSNFDQPNQIYVDDFTIERRGATKKILDVKALAADASADITWGNVAASYSVYVLPYKTDDLDTISASPVVVSTNSYKATDLEESTPYYAYVKAPGYEWSNPVEFRTFCAKSIPMFFDFDSDDDAYTELNAYNMKNYSYPLCVQSFSTDPERPNVSSITTASYLYNGKGHSLSLSMDAGRDAWVVFPQIKDTAIQDVEIEFYARAYSTSYKNTRVGVGVMTDPGDLTTYEEIEQFDLSTATYVRCYTHFMNYQGAGKYIALRWEENLEGGATGSYTDSYPIIDNVTIKKLGTCFTPKVWVASVSTETAIIAWDGYGLTEFDIVVDSLNTRTDAVLNTITEKTAGVKYVLNVKDTDRIELPKEKLHWGRTYYVYMRAKCETSEEMYWSIPVKVTLATPEVIDLPYTEGFDYFGSASGTMAAGWTRFDSISTSYPYCSTSAKYAGYAGLYLYNASSATSHGVVAAPKLAIDSLNKVKISFWGKASSAASTTYPDSLYIGVTPSVDSLASVTWLDTISIPTTTFTEYYTILEDWTQSMGQYIVFTTYHATKSNTLYLDEITFESLQDIKPFEVNAVDVADTYARLAWSGDATQGWQLVVTSEQINPDSLSKVAAEKIMYNQVVTTLPAYVDGLKAQTYYYVYVKPVAGKQWSNESNFMTQCVKLNPGKSYKENFDGKYPKPDASTTKYMEGPDCWTVGCEQLHPESGVMSNTYKPGLYNLIKTSTITATSLVHSAYSSFKFYSYYSTTASYKKELSNQWLATPELAVADLNTVTMSFWLKPSAMNANYVLYVGTMTDPQDLKTFTEVKKLTSMPTGWNKHEVAIENWTPEKGKYIAIVCKMTAASQTYYLDDIELSASTCKAANPVLSKLSDSSVRIAYANEPIDVRMMVVKDGTWNADKMNGETSAAYIAAMMDSTIFVSNDTLEQMQGKQFKGLAADTKYSVAFQTLCSEGNAKWVTIDFQTLCGPQSAAEFGTITFEEGYNDTTATSLTIDRPVPCWVTGSKTEGAAQTYIPYVLKSATLAPAGEKFLRLYSTTTYNGAYAIMPAVDVDSIARMKMNFKARANGNTASSLGAITSTYAASVIVGVVTDPSDMSTFVGVDTITYADNNIYDAQVRFNNYKGDADGNFGKYICFMSEFPKTNVMYIDNISVDTIGECEVPLTIKAADIEVESATITWNSVTEKSRVMVTSSAIDPKNWENNKENVIYNDTVSGTELQLTGLQGVTTYYVYVKSLCAEDGIWCLNGYSFITNCPEAAALPYVENFDRYPSGTKNHPACWYTYYNGTVGADAMYPYTYSSAKYGTEGNGLYFYNYSSYAAENKRATTATLPIAGNISRATLSFKYKSSSSVTAPGKLLVGLAKDATCLDSLMATVQYFDTITPKKSSTAWEDYSYDMKDLQGENMHIVMAIFYQTSVATGSIYLDDFKVEKTPTCFVPKASVDSTATTLAKVNIIPYFPTDNAWDLMVINKAKTDTLTYSTTDTSYIMTGLTHSEQYTLYVRTNCGEGDVSAWSDPVSFNTLYKVGAGFTYGFEEKEGMVYAPMSTSATYRVHPSLVVGNIQDSTTALSSTYIPYQVVSTSTAHYSRTGEYAMKLYNYNSTTYQFKHAYVVFPELIDAENLQVRFDAREVSTVNGGDTILDTNTYPQGVLEVGLVDASGDIESYETLASFHPSCYVMSEKVTEQKNKLYDQIVVPMPATIGDKRVVIMNTTPITSTWFIDNVKFEQKKNFTTPVWGKAVVDSTSITLNWEANGATEWNAYVVASVDAFPLDSVADSLVVAKQENIKATSYTFTGLKPATTYYAYLQVAGKEDVAASSARKLFKTAAIEMIQADSIISFEGTHTKKQSVDLYGLFPRATAVGDSLYAMANNWVVGNNVVKAHANSPWARLNGYAVTSTTKGASYDNIKVARSGSRALQIYTGAADPAGVGGWAAMPMVNVGFDTTQVDFYARPFSESNTGKVAIAGSTYKDKPLVVGTMTDPSDPATFEEITRLYYDDISLTTSIDISSLVDAGWQKMSFRLKGAAGKYIAIASPVAGQWYIDDISFGARTCLPPLKLRTEEIMAHAATLAWTPMDEGAPCRIQVCAKEDFTLLLADSLLADTNMFTIDHLDGVTEYFYRVRQECSETENSRWSNTASFMTACGETDGATIFTFEKDQGQLNIAGTTSYQYPQCWTTGTDYSSSTTTYSYVPRVQKSDAAAWYSHNTLSTNLKNIYSLRLYSSKSSTETSSYNQWIAMPELTSDQDMDTLQLSFYGLPGSYNPSTERINTTYTNGNYLPAIVVGVMSDPKDVKTFHALDTVVYTRDSLTTSTVASATNEFMFERFSVSLKGARQYGSYVTFMADYNAAAAMFPERAAKLTYWYTYMFIDDVQFEKLNECYAPTALSADNITISEADLNWEVSGGEKWIVRVSEDATFQDESLLIFNDTLETNTLHLSGLKTYTTYYWDVLQMCDATTKAPRTPLAEFHTLRVPMYTENFVEAVPQDWTRDSICAKRLFAGAPKSGTAATGWARQPNSKHHGIVGPHAFYNVYSTNRHEWFFTPQIVLNETQDAWLTFDAAMTVYTLGTTDKADLTPKYNNPDDQFIMAISDDGGKTWKRENAIIWNNETSNDPEDPGYIYGKGDRVLNELPIQVTSATDPVMVDLSKYRGKTIQIGFYGESSISNADNELHVGNVHVNYCYRDTTDQSACQFEDMTAFGGAIRVDGDKAPAGKHLYVHTMITTEDDLKQNPNRIDSVFVLRADYLSAPTREIYDTICEGEQAGSAWGFQDRAVSGVYKRKGVSAVTGCDSITVLNLTVNPRLYTEIWDTLCAGLCYTFQGQEYCKTTVVTDTLSSVVTGCDSIVTLFLTVKPMPEYEFDRQICEGTSFYLSPKYPALDKTGTYQDTVQTIYGCDSLLTVHLLVTAKIQIDIYDTICRGEKYRFEGKDYSATGVYPVNLVSVAGCDSIRTLYLQVVGPSPTLYVDTVVDAKDLPYFYGKTSITYPIGTPNGTYNDTVVIVSEEYGCTQTVYHKLTIYGASGLNDVMDDEDAPQKMVIDDQIFIRRGKQWYDATGRKTTFRKE